MDDVGRLDRLVARARSGDRARLAQVGALQALPPAVLIPLVLSWIDASLLWPSLGAAACLIAVSAWRHARSAVSPLPTVDHQLGLEGQLLTWAARRDRRQDPMVAWLESRLVGALARREPTVAQMLGPRRWRLGWTRWLIPVAALLLLIRLIGWGGALPGSTGGGPTRTAVGAPEPRQPDRGDPEGSDPANPAGSDGGGSGAAGSDASSGGSQPSGGTGAGGQQAGGDDGDGRNGGEREGDRSAAGREGSEGAGDASSPVRPDPGSSQGSHEQSGGEQSSSEQNGSEQRGAEQSGNEQSGNEQGGAEGPDSGGGKPQGAGEDPAGGADGRPAQDPGEPETPEGSENPSEPTKPEDGRSDPAREPSDGEPQGSGAAADSRGLDERRPVRDEFAVPDFVGDGAGKRTEAPVADIEGGGSRSPDRPSPPEQPRSAPQLKVDEPEADPASQEVFESAREAALRARHVPDDEREVVKRWFDRLVRRRR